MDELRKGILLFNAGEFFACHEVLEEAWVQERGPRKLFLQALIHIAVGLYHSQRGNPAGADGQLSKALRKLAFYLPAYEGVDTKRVYTDTLAIATLVRAGLPLQECLRIDIQSIPPVDVHFASKVI